MNPRTHRVIFNKSRGCILEASELKNPVKTAAITTEIDKWAEGGGYRVALHSLTGALSGGISGALGAAASASAAPLLQQLQGGVANSLQTAGLSPEAATGIARGIAGLTAAGVGAAVGGTAGAASALTIDANNRQLHPAETQRIKELAKSTGLSEDKLTRAACYAVKCWAEYPGGGKERDANFVSVAETFGLGKELAIIQSSGATTSLFNYSTSDQVKDGFKSTALPVIQNTGKAIGGGLAVVTGSTICSTSGVGCIVGGPLAVFGASEATEGATGLYRQYQDQGTGGFNPVRSGINSVSPVWGDAIYDGSYLGLSILTLGATVPLKVGASDGINRVNSMFGATVPRWQNPIIYPLTGTVVLPQTAAQGVLLYGVGAKVPAVVENVNKARDFK